MNRRRAGLLIIGIGVILALLGGVLVFQQVQNANEVLATEPQNLVAIAAIDVPARTVITADQITWTKVADNAFPVSSINYRPPQGQSDSDTAAYETSTLLPKLVGQFTPNTISKGQMFLTTELGQAQQKSTPSYDLTPGMVSFPFPAHLSGGSPANGDILIAFLDEVRAGDYVDIYYSTIEYPPSLVGTELALAQETPQKYLVTRPILQNLKVLNVGFFPGPDGTTPPAANDQRYLTFEVTPDQALTLKWLRDESTLYGNLDFILRAPEDTQPIPATTITYDQMSSTYKIGTGQ